MNLEKQLIKLNSKYNIPKNTLRLWYQRINSKEPKEWRGTLFNTLTALADMIEENNTRLFAKEFTKDEADCIKDTLKDIQIIDKTNFILEVGKRLLLKSNNQNLIKDFFNKAEKLSIFDIYSLTNYKGEK